MQKKGAMYRAYHEGVPLHSPKSAIASTSSVKEARCGKNTISFHITSDVKPLYPEEYNRIMVGFLS